MVICPDCGKDVKDAKFCSNCGALLQQKEEKQTIDIEDTTQNEDVDIEVNASEIDEKESTDIIPVETTQKSKSKFCANCGYELNGNFKFCPECGYDLSGRVGANRSDVPSVKSEKNMLLSIILSIIFPGLGHFYLGLDHKGIMFLLGYIISAALILLLVGFILIFVVWIWALIDVIQSTNAINNGEYVEDKLF